MFSSYMVSISLMWEVFRTCAKLIIPNSAHRILYISQVVPIYSQVWKALEQTLRFVLKEREKEMIETTGWRRIIKEKAIIDMQICQGNHVFKFRELLINKLIDILSLSINLKSNPPFKNPSPEKLDDFVGTLYHFFKY